MSSLKSLMRIEICLNQNQSIKKTCIISLDINNETLYQNLIKLVKQKLQNKVKSKKRSKPLRLFLVQTGEEITNKNINKLINHDYANNFTSSLTIAVSLGEEFQGKPSQRLQKDAVHEEYKKHADIDYEKIMEKIMLHKTKVLQFKALKNELSVYFDKDEAAKIAKQKMKEYAANNSIKSNRTVVAQYVSNPKLLLHQVDELMCFVDDFDFNDEKQIFIPKIKYYKQLTNWSCGPATIRMMLHTLLNEENTEKRLIKILHTNNKHGTLQKDMISIAENNEKYGKYLDYQYGDYGTINKLKQLTKQGWMVIVEWSLNDCPHFALFSHESNETIIYLNDPWFGKLYQVEKYDFIRRWNVYQSNFEGYDFKLHDRESCRWYLAFRAKSK